MFFYTCIKGLKRKDKNDRFNLKKNIRLIDYEKIVDKDNKRFVAFG